MKQSFFATRRGADTFPVSLTLTLALFAVLSASAVAEARHWPQWRGPAANGVAAADAQPPTTWSEAQNVRWKTPIPGAGHSTPIIWENKIFILTAVPVKEDAAGVRPSRLQNTFPVQNRGGRGRRGGFGRQQAPTTPHEFKVICLDRRTGSVIWDRTAKREVPHEGHHGTNTYASGSPVTDGKHVFAFFSSYGLFCYDMDGRLVWQKDFGDMKTRNAFGEGVSPTLADGKLIILWDTEEESWIAAVDAGTGEQLWKKERDERTSWATPLVVDYGGRKEVIVNATNAVRSYDLNSGDLLWQCSGQTANAIPSPVTDGSRVYVMSGFRGNAAYGIRLGGEGKLDDTEQVVWKLDRGTPYVPSPALHEGTLYFLSGNSARLSAVDANTGEPFYQQHRLEGIRGVYASPVVAGGHVYVAGREGTTVVLKQGPEPEVVAVNKLDDPIDASPVVVGDELFIRTHTHLYCIAN